jgi:hypothetical protein
MADDDNFGAVGIACTTCKHRAVLRLHYGPDEINGRPLPLTGQQGQNCRSTTLPGGGSRRWPRPTLGGRQIVAKPKRPGAPSVR